MPTPCPFRSRTGPLVLLRAVVIGSAVAALLPASTMGAADVRRDPSRQVFALPSAQRGLPFPASAVGVPVHLRLHPRESPRPSDVGLGAWAARRARGTQPAGGSRRTQPARPTVLILVPTDLAAVPVGILRVRGTVGPRGEAVRVLVNGVRAVVQSGMFSAEVNVTPHTLILSAVATTSGGRRDCHQVGLAVGEAPENGPRLRASPDGAVVALPQRFSILPAAVLPGAPAEPDGDDAGDSPAETAGRARFAVGNLMARSSPPTGTGAWAAGEVPMGLALSAAHLDGRGLPAEPDVAETGHRAAVEAMRRALAIRPRPEDRVEAFKPGEAGPQRRIPAGADALSLRTRGEEDIEQNPRGMPLGSTYSFGLLFIFDTDGFRQIRWY